MPKLSQTESLQRTVDILEWYGWANGPDIFHDLKDGPRNLLMALQQACRNSIPLYIECVDCLAGRLKVEEGVNHALGIVKWENNKTRSIDDINNLLLDRLNA